MDWNHWLTFNLRNIKGSNEETHWTTTFGVTLDLIWRQRNELVFEQKSTHVAVMKMKIRNQVDWIICCMEKNQTMWPGLLPSSQILNCAWTPPPMGVCKLNSDGSVRNNGRLVSCGGVLRDSSSNFIFAFSRKLPPCSVDDAEILGIYHGLLIAWSKGYRKIIVETDSQNAIDSIIKERMAPRSINQLARNVLDVGGGALMTTLLKVDRDANCVADLLAKNSYSVRDNFVFYSSIPAFLIAALTIDGCGLSLV